MSAAPAAAARRIHQVTLTGSLLNGAAQARYLGITPETLSRWKRIYGPGGRHADHPYPTHTPGLVVQVGDMACLREADLKAWNETRPARVNGRPRVIPIGLTGPQWVALQALTDGGPISRATAVRLEAAGYATIDQDGAPHITDAGRALVAEHRGA